MRVARAAAISKSLQLPEKKLVRTARAQLHQMLACCSPQYEVPQANEGGDSAHVRTAAGPLAHERLPPPFFRLFKQAESPSDKHAKQGAHDEVDFACMDIVQKTELSTSVRLAAWSVWRKTKRLLTHPCSQKSKLP
jgi:hypothetical protein